VSNKIKRIKMTGKSGIIKLTNLAKKAGFEYTRSHGYKYSTAFIKNPENGKVVYISLSDKDMRPQELLFRTAPEIGDLDNHGINNFVKISKDNFSEALVKISKLLN
jgi:hypothetical protein